MRVQRGSIPPGLTLACPLSPTQNCSSANFSTTTSVSTRLLRRDGISTDTDTAYWYQYLLILLLILVQKLQNEREWGKKTGKHCTAKRKTTGRFSLMPVDEDK